MLKRLKKITVRTVAVLNVLLVLLMLLVGYSSWFNPVDHPLLAVSGLLFPAFLAVNLAFLAFWLFFHWRGAIIPVAGFLLCYAPVRAYLPLNVSQEPPEDAIKVLSYNVYMFAGWAFAPGEENTILAYIRDSQADIVCLQESAAGEVKQSEIDSCLNPVYPYCEKLKKTGKDGTLHTLYSKFPILSVERIPYESSSNGSVAFVVDVRGERVLVVSNHLESIKLSADEKDKFKGLVRGEFAEEEAKAETRGLLRKLSAASVRRAPEADAVVNYIKEKRQEGMSVIACGDFNDGPISYSRQRFADVLTDCYVASGNGPGFSYQNNGMYVRIDHLFCSEEWVPYGAKVDRQVTASDHFPIYCWLKKRPKT